MTSQQAWKRLSLILVIYFGLSLAYSLWLPLGHAPDEIDHFLYTRFIARYNRLPLNDEERETAGKKAYLPPLYHGLTAALVGWSEDGGVSPRLKFLKQSPRYDLARALFYTETMVNTEDELPPYRGEVLLWHLGRVVSIIWGAGILAVTFLTALEIFPKNYRLALAITVITALTPTFIYISASLSYESLSALLIGLYFWLLVKIFKGDDHWRIYFGLGLLLGLAVTAKYAAVILPAQVVLVLAYLAWRQHWGWLGWLKRLLLTGLAAIVGSSWWFLFLAVNFNKIDQYGLIVGLLKPILAGGTDSTQNYTAFLLTGGQIGGFGQINPPPVGDWAWQIFQSFWAEKNENYPVALLPMLLLGLACGVALAGWLKQWRRAPAQRVWLGFLASPVIFFLVFPFLRYVVQGELSHTAQGRHVLFPIVTVFALLLVTGWQAWFSPKIHRFLVMILAAGLACWSLAQLLVAGTNSTAPLPVRTTLDVAAQIPNRLDRAFGSHLVLLGYDARLIPEEGMLKLALYWQSPSYADEDYTLSLNLVRAGQPALQWMAYPLNGRYPTRVWENWETIRDDLALPLFDLPPGDYQIHLQLRSSQEPLPVNQADNLVLTTVTIPPVSPLKPNIALPVMIDNRPVISGLTLWQTEAYRKFNYLEYQPRMVVSWVWQGQSSTSEQVKWLLVNNDGQVFPTQTAATHWAYMLVGADWPPGPYRLRAEVWRDNMVVASSETAPLFTVFNKQPRLIQPPTVTYPLEVNFANQVKLLGYDLPNRQVKAGQGIPLTFYWQGLRTMGYNYTFFTKLLDQQQRQWGILERFPRDGYKTMHWLENEVVIDPFETPIPADTPDGVYWLNVGLYLRVDKTVVPLPVISQGQLTELTSVNLGPIKIGGPPPGVVINQVDPAQPLAVDFNNIIRLRGYDLTRLDQSFLLKLYWEGLAPVDKDYTIFVHVRNQAGQTVAQMDHLPADGRYSTLLWSPGEIIRDELRLPIPPDLPPGQYTLVTGMYDFATGSRLPLAGSTDNSAILTTVAWR